MVLKNGLTYCMFLNIADSLVQLQLLPEVSVVLTTENMILTPTMFIWHLCLLSRVNGLNFHFNPARSLRSPGAHAQIEDPTLCVSPL